MRHLKLSKELYDLRHIQKTIHEFNKLAYMKIADSGNYWDVMFSHFLCGEEITVREFENYLICLENQ